MDAPVDVTKVHLETPRLLFRPWEESDLDDFFAYASVDGVGPMAGWRPHENREVSRAVLRRFIDEKKTFALVLKESGHVIGSIGLERLERSEDPAPDRLGREIGYVLGKDHWGRGLMPEAVKAVIEYCFTVWNYDFLTCGHFLRNSRSRRVVEKCGFTFWKEAAYRTQLGTVEQTLLYVRYNPRKREEHHV